MLWSNMYFMQQLKFFKMKRGIFVAGLREEIVASADQVLELMKFGECKFYLSFKW